MRRMISAVHFSNRPRPLSFFARPGSARRRRPGCGGTAARGRVPEIAAGTTGAPERAPSSAAPPLPSTSPVRFAGTLGENTDAAAVLERPQRRPHRGHPPASRSSGLHAQARDDRPEDGDREELLLGQIGDRAAEADPEHHRIEVRDVVAGDDHGPSRRNVLRADGLKAVDRRTRSRQSMRLTV